MSVRIEELTGDRIVDILPELARLRIEVFREWPYLYDGSYAYERDYIADFAGGPGAFVAAAMDGDRVVGAATASRMDGHAQEFAEPLIKRGYDISHIAYFGESVLLRSYRGRGIGHRFFDVREAKARADGCDTATFCTVARPVDHPQRPQDHRPLDAFWRRRGYEPVPGLVGSFSWTDIGEDAETAKPMHYWMRRL